MRCPTLSLALSVLLAASPKIHNSTIAAQSSAIQGQVVLQDGTPVRLRLNHNVSSADATVGESVDFEVLDEVNINGAAVIPKSSTAIGTVTEAVPKRRMARGGKLEIVLDYVRLGDTEKAPIRAVKDAKGGGHTGGMTAGIVATGLIFWPAAPFFLFMHGKDITIPKGAEVVGYVNGDMKLNAANFSHATEPTISTPTGNSTAAVLPAANKTPGSAQSPAPAAQSQVSAVSSSVTVNSTPPGAEIFVDDDFAGDTPSTLNLSSGKHVVSVRKPGFQEWIRKVSLSGGSITLNAELTHGTDELHPVNPPIAPDTRKEPVAVAVVTDPSPKPLGWIGVHAQNSGDVAVVTNVNPDSPGANAGIQVGDVIVALDGRLIKGKDFESIVAALKPGTQISLNYARGAASHEVQITVGSHN
jgi:membrane-associated protease RseP (regulator of RpoE activity)